MKKNLIDVVQFILNNNPELANEIIKQAIIIKSKSDEKAFTDIFIYKKWGAGESVSGNGSSLEYTTSLRSQLGKFFEKFSIESIFDAPCGDFNWMKSVMSMSPNINYPRFSNRDLSMIVTDQTRPL